MTETTTAQQRTASGHSAPSVDDARAAAHAIASRVKGVDRIELYGSVARGEAHPGSDIDLVVICDDIDYGERSGIASECWTATRDIPHSIGLMVTDHHEWGIRSSLSTTIERSIRDDLVGLYASERNDSDGALRSMATTRKHLEMPVSDLQEAYVRLNETRLAYKSLLGAAKHTARKQSSSDVRDRYRIMLKYCDQILETSLKSLQHALGDRPSPRTHALGVLLRNLPADAPEASRVQAALDGLRVEHLPPSVRDDEDLQAEYTNWRSHGTYDLPSKAAKHLSASRVEAYLDAVTEVSEILLDALVSRSDGGSLPETDDISSYLLHKRMFERWRARYDLETGRRRSVIGRTKSLLALKTRRAGRDDSRRSGR